MWCIIKHFKRNITCYIFCIYTRIIYIIYNIILCARCVSIAASRASLFELCKYFIITVKFNDDYISHTMTTIRIWAHTLYKYYTGTYYKYNIILYTLSFTLSFYTERVSVKCTDEYKIGTYIFIICIYFILH